MFNLLKKENQDTLRKIVPAIGEPFEVVLGGHTVKVKYKKPEIHEELAMSGFGEKAGNEFAKIAGLDSPEIHIRIITEAIARAWAFYALYKEDGKTRLFSSIDETKAFRGKEISINELAAITQAIDALHKATENDLKN